MACLIKIEAFDDEYNNSALTRDGIWVSKTTMPTNVLDLTDEKRESLFPISTMHFYCRHDSNNIRWYITCVHEQETIQFLKEAQKIGCILLKCQLEKIQ